MPSCLVHMRAQLFIARSFKAPVELSTPAEIEDHLQILKILPLGLYPNGSQFYNFSHFVPDPDKVEDFGGEDCIIEITVSP
jgi:hypothetical protein